MIRFGWIPVSIQTCGRIPRLPFIMFFLPPRGPSCTIGQRGHGFSVVNERVSRPYSSSLFDRCPFDRWLFDGLFPWRWFLVLDHWLSLAWGLDVSGLDLDTRRRTRRRSRFSHDVCLCSCFPIVFFLTVNNYCFFCAVGVDILKVGVLVSPVSPLVDMQLERRTDQTQVGRESPTCYHLLNYSKRCLLYLPPWYTWSSHWIPQCRSCYGSYNMEVWYRKHGGLLQNLYSFCAVQPLHGKVLSNPLLPPAWLNPSSMLELLARRPPNIPVSFLKNSMPCEKVRPCCPLTMKLPLQWSTKIGQLHTPDI